MSSPWETALVLALLATLVAASITDLRSRVIPNGLTSASAAVALLIATLTDPASLGPRALAGLAAGGLLLLVALAHPEGMGMGDAKLAAVMGLYLRAAVAPALLVAFASGAVVGLAMIARYGPLARKRALPFGPFLALGGVIGLWFGRDLVGWYADAVLRG